MAHAVSVPCWCTRAAAEFHPVEICSIFDEAVVGRRARMPRPERLVNGVLEEPFGMVRCALATRRADLCPIARIEALEASSRCFEDQIAWSESFDCGALKLELLADPPCAWLSVEPIEISVPNGGQTHCRVCRVTDERRGHGGLDVMCGLSVDADTTDDPCRDNDT